MNGHFTNYAIQDDADRYTAARIAHWNQVHRTLDSRKGLGNYYQRLLIRRYQFHVPPGLHVLELGCGQGDLLAALKPSLGVGVDFSAEAISRAAKRHPSLRFVRMDAHQLAFEQPFDVVILSDLINDLWDVQTVFEQIHRICRPHTRLILNAYSHLWEVPLKSTQRLGLSKPNLEQNWLTVEDVAHLLHLTNFEVIKRAPAILLPLPIPLLSSLSNRLLVHLWPFTLLALTNFIIARPAPQSVPGPVDPPSTSIIIPARNEAGNIEALFQRLPEMPRTELVFVEGHSSDGTYETITRQIAAHPERTCLLIKQTGTGKGDAVRLGFEKASGDALIILDADLTVPPEDLPRFLHALASGKGDFINGVRLVYPLEDRAMHTLNKAGNKFFSLAFSWLLGQPIKDTLCGTKALWKRDYERIAANRAYFGDFDPFGDFDLLFGAARLNLKIVDLPVRYRARTYGRTNINRWRHGWLLLRMAAFAAWRLKFI